MDSYIQILCRFQKCSSVMKNEKNLPWGGKGWFFITDGGGTFRLLFWNLRKIWIKESIDLNSVQFGRRCKIGWVTSVIWKLTITYLVKILPCFSLEYYTIRCWKQKQITFFESLPSFHFKRYFPLIAFFSLGRIFANF